MNKKKVKEMVGPLMGADGQKVTSSWEKAKLLNSFFTSVFM